jgi:hypothetical protein
MPNYRTHRLKESARQQFRFAPHVSGAAVIKQRDYEEGPEIEAPSPYSAFFASRHTGEPLQVGDVLESESGDLRICKYVGFEAAQWFVPEPKPEEVLVPDATA